MEIRGHLLVGEGVEFRESPNQGGRFTEEHLDTIIVHYTAEPDAESAIHTLTDPQREVSAHLVVARSGAITQLLPFDVIGWHAGVSRWGGREGLNQYSLGIEIDNAGQLEEHEGRFVAWFGQEYPAEEVVWGIHRHQTRPTPWHRFTGEQLTRVEEVCRLLAREYDIRHILGHEEIAPSRKVDPGPAFPLDELRARVLAGSVLEKLSLRGTVTASRLPLRDRPDSRARHVAGRGESG